MTTTRRLFIALASLVVIGYSLAVLYHVRTHNDLGIYLLISRQSNDEPNLGPEIAKVDQSLSTRRTPQVEEPGPVPKPGDILLRVGDRPVPTFLHFKKQESRLNGLAGEDEVDGVVTNSQGRWIRVEYLPIASHGRSHHDGAADRREAQPPEVRTADSNDGEPSAESAGLVPTVTWLRLKPRATRAVVASIIWFLLEMVGLAIGALVVRRRPDDRTAMLFFALCVVNAVTFMGAFHWANLAGTWWLIFPFAFFGMLLAPMALHFLLVFPRPAAIVARWPRAVPVAVYVLPALWIIAMFACMVQINLLFAHHAGALELSDWLDVLRKLIYGYLGVSLVMVVAGHWALVYGFLTSETKWERAQARWLLTAVVLATFPMLYLMYLGNSNRAEFAYGVATQWTMYLTSMLFTVAYAVSITRYRLLDMGRIARRGLWYVAISFAASGVFSLLVGLATALVGGYYFSWENAVAAGLTATLVVVALSWVRDQFQHALDRRFYREKYQIDSAMQRLGHAVEQLVEPAQLARRMLESVYNAVGADRGAVYLRREGGGTFDLVAQHGTFPSQLRPQETIASDNPLVIEVVRSGLLMARGGRTSNSPGQQILSRAGGDLALALEQDGDAVGLVVLGPKELDLSYSAEDRNFLSALAHSTTLALYSAQGHRTIERLNEELRGQLDMIAQQQQQIRMLQGELLSRRSVSIEPTESSRDELPPTPAQALIRGSSPAVRSLLSNVAKIAGSTSSVLIRGESGTGKGLLAQAIHLSSPRADGPLVTVHCAALSPSLLESELFGHVRGAFTGADRDKVGRFELADDGTMFLDEIGDISLDTQIKLLRVLQEKSFERVGGTKTQSVDVRLIAATHQNLEELISRGRFREDLYFRLNVISIVCPPLRERRDDIFELALHFVERFARQANKRITRIDQAAIDVLLNYAWPGNIRQLENAIERAVVLAEGDTIHRDDLPPEIVAAATQAMHSRRGYKVKVERLADGSRLLQGKVGAKGLVLPSPLASSSAAGISSGSGLASVGRTDSVRTVPGDAANSNDGSVAAISEHGTGEKDVGTLGGSRSSIHSTASHAALPGSNAGSSSIVVPGAAPAAGSSIHSMASMSRGSTDSAPVGSSTTSSTASATISANSSDTIDAAYDEIERARLVEVLSRCGGNKARAARELGIPRSTLFSKLKRYGIE